MSYLLHLRPCQVGESLLLLPAPPGIVPDHRAGGTDGLGGSHWLLAPTPEQRRTLATLPVGTDFCDVNGQPSFKLTGQLRLPSPGHALACPLLTALLPCAGGKAAFSTRKEGRSLAWVTLSDKGSLGQREDQSGPAIEALLARHLPLCHSQGFLLPDEADALRALLTDLALCQGFDLICTTGGTGLSPRDIAPQVTASVLDLPLPGFSQAMMAASLKATPHAAISRAVAGTLGRSIIINLPGSKRGATENLAAVLPALSHALDKLHGDPADCGG
ncbi:MAG: MogA/MoaB family molybdenum cofactor biosynthesis protein [Desulfovibrio sp.]|nr:MogA/MoaB family molybdenum cofactor biosynthesis protein [Desulfovibrio sp.]